MWDQSHAFDTTWFFGLNRTTKIRLLESEKVARANARRSLVAARYIPTGKAIDAVAKDFGVTPLEGKGRAGQRCGAASATAVVVSCR